MKTRCRLIILIVVTALLGASSASAQQRYDVPWRVAGDTIITVSDSITLAFPIISRASQDYTAEQWERPFRVRLTHWASDESFSCTLSWPSTVAVRFRHTDNTLFTLLPASPIPLRLEWSENAER